MRPSEWTFGVSARAQQVRPAPAALAQGQLRAAGAVFQLQDRQARHALAQAVFVHKQGRIADRTLQNQEHRASGLNLVIAAIALWNTLYMQRAVEHLREREIAAPDELLAHLSPMSWAHVGLTGDYLWADAATAGGFRPLNDPADRLYRAA